VIAVEMPPKAASNGAAPTETSRQQALKRGTLTDAEYHELLQASMQAEAKQQEMDAWEASKGSGGGKAGGGGGSSGGRGSVGGGGGADGAGADGRRGLGREHAGSSSGGASSNGSHNSSEQGDFYDDEGDMDQPQGKQSYVGMAKAAYGSLLDYLLKPPRSEYKLEDLGPVNFKLGGHKFERVDLQLSNPRGLALACSHWKRAGAAAGDSPQPCVIYLHGHGSCRAEAAMVLSCALSAGASVFSFDFSGAGHSEGDFVSLGFFERDDLQTVVDFLQVLTS
jgi:hypothetical protein